MNRSTLVRLCLPMLIALCMLGAALFALGGPPVLAQPLAPSGVTLDYPGAAPCNTTLQACISGSGVGDVISVAVGTFITNELVIAHSITLQGRGASSTKIGSLGAQRVISIGANIAAGVTISNLSVFSGDLTSGTEGGAGIFAGAGTPLSVLNAEVLSNTIAASLGQSGAGILAGAPITLVNVVFANNQALFGAGGGLRATSTANIIGGRFERNVAFNPGGGLRASGALTMINVTVLSNTVTAAGQDGGGVSALGGLFMQGGLVQNNVAADSGGGIIANAATITASNIISNAANRGGGIFVTGGLNITNTTFDKNSARAGDGGSIYASGGVTISIEGTGNPSQTVIANSSAITNGGGIFAAGNVLLVGAVSFNVDKALNGEGGAIYTNDLLDSSGQSVLLAVKFTGNTALGKGGAVRALGKVNLLNLPAFQNNSAGGGTTADGGAVYADGTVLLSRGTSSGNAARNGGAVYALGNIKFNVHDTLNNTAVQNGGCAYSQQNIIYNSADAKDCVAGQFGGAAYSPLTVTLQGNDVGLFNQNRAGNSGGAAFANVVEVFAAQVVSNTAPVGGGVAATRTLDIRNSTFISNTAGSAGGAVVALSGNAFITNSLFASNKVTVTNGSGGAIDARGALTVRRSSFLRNSAGSWGGGAIYFDPTSANTLRVENSLFAGNTAANPGFGAAIAVVNPNTTQLFYNTFANGATQNSGAAIAMNDGSASIIDNIIADHAMGIQKTGGTVTEDFNLFFNNTSNTSGGVTSGASSFNGNPLFMSAASDDYHISPGSPAIDKASNLGIFEDFDGDLRPLGAGFDIGYDEFRPTRLFLPLIVR